MEEQELLLSFLSGGGSKKLGIVLQMYFGCDFLCPHTTIVSGIVNYPIAYMSCCSGTVVTVFRPVKSVVREYISRRINFRLYMYKNVQTRKDEVASVHCGSTEHINDNKWGFS